MSRHRYLSISLLVICVVTWMPGAFGASDEVSPRPNVIFILCDDLGWGDFGVLHQNDSTHSKRHHTPMIDQMAAEGMQLRNHYCPAPVCAPSRGSLLTGTHQGHAEVRDNQFDKMLEDNHTLGTVMRHAGYRTALIGKYGLQGKGDSAKSWPAYPTKRGFDDFFGYVRHVDGHVHYPANHWPLGNSEKHQSPKEVWSNDTEVSADLAKCYTTDLFTAKSKHWIIDHASMHPSQPFFLYLAYDTPHAALQIPTGPYPEGRGVNGGVQWTGQPGRMINTAVGEIDSYRHPDYVGKGWSDVEERFATMVRRIDDCVGDLLHTLRELGIAEDTLVVISSDNGPHNESYIRGMEYDPTSFESFGPLEGIKRDVFEGGIREPTLAWWPGHIPAGSIDQNPSQFHDWMATFADMGGNQPPARCDGVSLRQLLTGESTSHDGQVYVEYFNNGRVPKYPPFKESRQGSKRGQQQVIFVDGYKGVRTDIRSHKDPFAIYDLLNDPSERNNLASGGPKFDELQNAMHDRVLQLRRPNDSAKRPYDNVPVPAIKVAQTTPGLIVSLFDGTFDYAPQVKSLHRSRSIAVKGFTDMLDVSKSTGAVEWAGYIRVAKTGDYEVSLATSTPAFLRIHDAAVIDNDFGHQSDTQKSATIKLAAGLHPIRLTALVVGGESPMIQLTCSGDHAFLHDAVDIR